MSDKKKLISLIVPVFNEEENIDVFFTAVNAVTDRLSDRFDFELLFTDNHSTDSTFSKLEAIAEKDRRVRVIRFSRNFGYQKSILTGYLNARGDAAIQLDVDLQDPPDMIEQFLEKWELGFEVVYGVRRSREEGWLISKTRSAFYRIIRVLSETDLPLDAGDFRLIDRRILDILALVKDRNPYLRGMIAVMGFRQVGIPYDRKDRLIGSSKFSLGEYFQIALDGIVSQSVMPLRFATYTGLGVTAITLVLLVGYAFGKLFLGAEWPAGFTTLTVLILFGISLNALFLGVIGEYLARLYRQSVETPLTLVEAELPTDTRNGSKNENR